LTINLHRKIRARQPDAYKKYFEGAPKLMPYSKINETQAARDLILTWKEML
jgi:hypothetical protein